MSKKRSQKGTGLLWIKRLVELTEEQAVAKIKAAGFIDRVMQRDGEFFVGTTDYRGDRVNLVIKNGKVVKADIG